MLRKKNGIKKSWYIINLSHTVGNFMKTNKKYSGELVKITGLISERVQGGIINSTCITE